MKILLATICVTSYISQICCNIKPLQYQICYCWKVYVEPVLNITGSLLFLNELSLSNIYVALVVDNH